MKFLICGGYGFIGSAFIRNHLENNHNDEIINIDNMSLGSNKNNLDVLKNNDNYRHEKGDISNLKLDLQ